MITGLLILALALIALAIDAALTRRHESRK